MSEDEKKGVDADAIEARRKDGDLNRKLDEISSQLRALTRDREESTVGKAGETTAERVRRESNDSTVHLSRRTAVRERRLSSAYQDAAIGVIEEHLDFGDMVYLKVADIAHLQDDLSRWIARVGRSPLLARFGKLIISLAVIAVLGIIAVEIVQPEDLRILQDTLNNERNLYIFVGLVAITVGAVFYYLWSSRRRARREGLS